MGPRLSFHTVVEKENISYICIYIYIYIYIILFALNLIVYFRTLESVDLFIAAIRGHSLKLRYVEIVLIGKIVMVYDIVYLVGFAS